MCDGNNNIYHLYILPSRWLFLLQFKEFSDAIYEIFQNARCMPMKFFVEENLDSWHPKTHGPRNYLQSFYLAALINKCGGKQYPFAEYQNVCTRKRTRSSHKESENNGTSSLSSDNETTPKNKKSFGGNINANFNAFMNKRYEIIINADNVLFNIRTTKPKFVSTLFQHFLDSKLYRLSLQQLDFEMDSTGYPDNKNFFELGYCGHNQFT